MSNISCRAQVFLAHQRFRRLTTSWIFDFWRKTAYWNTEISVCCFPSKIKIHLKYWHSLLLLKTPFSDVSVITSCVNISGGEQVFLAHQRFRRLTTSLIFDFWRKTAYWKFLVPWMLKLPLTSVLKSYFIINIVLSRQQFHFNRTLDQISL